MQFWLAFGISEVFESGSGSSVRVLEPACASFSDAADRLAELDVPMVGGEVMEANAYIVQADTQLEASSYIRAVFMEGEASPHVKLVQRGIRTRPMPRLPPEIEHLSRVLGELCITHQLTELALSRVTSDEQRDRLDHHRLVIEELGYGLRVLRGDDVSATEGQSGRGRLGYGRGQIGDAESTTLAGALDGLTTELGIARHQVDGAVQIVSNTGEQLLQALGAELDRFRDTVGEMRLRLGSAE